MSLSWLPVDGDPLARAFETYAENGWAVFPLHGIVNGKCTCGHADCDNQGKHPRTTNGFKDATTDVKQIREWLKRWPNSNIGAPPPSSHVVLDVDVSGGIESRAALELEHGSLPITTRQISGSLGEHQVFTDPAIDELRQDVKFRPGLDTRCAGRGYIVVAPSLHISGRRYRWHTVVSPAPLPGWLRALIVKPKVVRTEYVPAPVVDARHLTKRQRYAEAVLRGESDAVASTTPGSKNQSGRNDRLNKAWWRVLQFRDVLPEGRARSELFRAALACGLPEREIEKVLR